MALFSDTRVHLHNALPIPNENAVPPSFLPISEALSIDPPNIQLAAPARVRFPYTDGELDSRRESALQMFEFNPGSGAWQPIPSLLDAQANALTFQINRFGVFGFSGPALAAGDVNGDGVTDGFDVDPFVFLLTQGEELYREQFPQHPDPQFVADINLDGQIDGFDVDGFVRILTGAGVSPAELRALGIPEPSTFALLSLATAIVLITQFGRKWQSP